MRAFAAAIILAVIGAALGTIHHVIYRSGFDDATEIAKLEKKKTDDAARDKYDKQAATALQTERALRKTIADMSADRIEKEANYENVISGLRADARSGALKLRIAVARRPVSECATSTDTTAAGGTGAETLADIMPGTADRIIGIAGGSAKDVRDYNRVIDLYEAARAVCNSQVN
jgi:hypothetical protein